MIKANDIKILITNPAVRIVHIPTGTFVESKSYDSVTKNKRTALNLLIDILKSNIK